MRFGMGGWGADGHRRRLQGGRCSKKDNSLTGNMKRVGRGVAGETGRQRWRWWWEGGGGWICVSARHAHVRLTPACQCGGCAVSAP